MDDKKKQQKSIVQSMTNEELKNLDVLTYAQIKRIARGSGRTEMEVKKIIKEYSAKD